MELSALLGLPGFWLGAAVVLLSQWGRFSELSAETNSGGSAPSSLLLQLKPRDLASGRVFALALLAFLMISFLGYLLLCFVPSGVLTGYYKLAGTTPTTVDSAVYPLFVALALVGITQPIPGLKNFATLQTSIFHKWIGVPGMVVSVSADFYSQILARCDLPGMSDRARAEALSAEIENLLDDFWIDNIRPFADLHFYRQQIVGMKLDRSDELDQVKRGSAREKKFILQELILAACVAAVRANGGGALKQLAAELDVSMPGDPPNKNAAVMGGVIVVGLCALLLIGILPSTPILSQVAAYFGGPGFWPAGPYYATQYVVINFLPIPLCAALLIVNTDTSKIQNRASIALFDVLSLLSRWFLLLFVLVVFYDYLQAFYDRGVLDGSYEGDLLDFMSSRLLTFSIHAAGVVVCCFALIVFVIRGGLGTSGGRTLAHAATLAAIAAAGAYLFALVRIQYQFTEGSRPGAEFTFLLVVLNVASAILTYALVVQAAKRMSDTRPVTRDRRPPPKEQPQAAENDVGVAI